MYGRHGSDREPLSPAEIERLATEKWGKPKSRNRHELRFGTNGKISVELTGDKAGVWNDFSESRGGRFGPTGSTERRWNFKGLGRPANTWRYRARDGSPVGVARFDSEAGKDYRPFVIGEDGNIAKVGDPESGFRLYNADLLAAKPDAIVLVVEGEKTAEAAMTALAQEIEAQTGKAVVATTWPHGAKAIGKADFSDLKGRDCILIPDADKPGREAMRDVAEILGEIGADRVSLVDMPDWLPEGWDVADQLPVGRFTWSMFASLCLDAPRLALDRPEFLPQPWIDLALPPRDYLLDGLLCTTSRWLLYGETGVGKTLVSLDLAYALAAGANFCGWHASRPARVMYLDGEMPAETMKERITAAAALYGTQANLFTYNRDRLREGEMPPLNTEPGQQWLLREIDRVKPDVIFFDSVMALLIGNMSDEESWEPMRPFIRELSRRRIAQVWLHHTGNDTSRSYGTSTRTWEMDSVVALKKENGDGAIRLSFDKARLRTPATAKLYAPQILHRDDHGWTTSEAPAQRRITNVVESLCGWLLECLDELTTDIPTEAGHTSVLVRKVALPRLQDEMIKRGYLDRTDKGRMTGTARSSFSRAKTQLIAKNLITERDTMIWRIPK